MKRHEIKMLLAKFLDRANCWQCNSEIVNTLQTLEQEMLNGILSIIFLKIYFKCSFYETMMKKEESADVSIDIYIFHHGSSRSYWEAK